MTDLSLPPSTHPGPFVDSGSNAVSALNSNQRQSLSNGFVVDEEEDYTIKCVCDYQDDDGNTVLCETCETWQHIECYYPGTKGPGSEESHNCVDCEPRYIDRRRATERQRARRTDVGTVDRKAKKPAAGGKSHKKKAKAGDHPPGSNGWSNEKPEPGASSRNGHGGSHNSGSPREQLPPSSSSSAKRPKANHKSSHSIHTQTVPLKLPAPSSRRSTSASHTLQSPSKTSHNAQSSESEPFSYQFMHLYDNDPGDTPMKANLFNDIGITSNLSLWSHDPDEVREATNGRSHQDIFCRCDQSLESMNLAPIQKETKTDESIERLGRHPTWTYLTVNLDTPKNAIVGELRGKIGHMKDYVQDEANRWEYLRHPLPFVFFHPALPIYIDTRREGTICRYIRRSCKPNVHLKTILENESDYHFCFATNKNLEPGTELTIPWTPDEHVRAFTRQLDGGIKHEGSIDTDENYIREYFLKVLADFGGCACENPDDCPLTMWSRRDRHPSSDHKPANGKTKRGRKAGAHKSSQNAKTASSRSGSEALRYQDDDEADDGRSTSASSRSKPQSRDLTPSYQGANEKPTALGLELSDREKRKIAALEKNFEQLENDKGQQAPKKKQKRTSGGPTPGTPLPPASASRTNFPDSKSDKMLDAKVDLNFVSMPSTPAANGRPRYVDAGTARRGSHSPLTQPSYSFPPVKGTSNPHSPTVSSPLSRPPHYVDCSTQVDLDEEESAGSGPVAQTPRKPFISLTKRLLRRCHKERAILDKRKEESDRLASATPSPVAQEQAKAASPAISSTSVDVKDRDGDMVMDDAERKASPLQFSLSDGPLDKSRASDAGAQPQQRPDLVMADAPPKSPISPSRPSPALLLHAEHVNASNGVRASGLQVQLPSSLPTPDAHTTNGSTLPTPAKLVLGANAIQSPTPQTPTTNSHLFPFATPTSSSPSFASAHGLSPANPSLNLVQPSPIKKKLSLGDYMSRRIGNINKSEPPLGHHAGANLPASPAIAGSNGVGSSGSVTPTTGDTSSLATATASRLVSPLAPLSEEASAAQGGYSGGASASERVLVDTPMTENADPMPSVIMTVTAGKS